MSELPRGTVTFLFTDIEESTSLLRRYGDRYAEVLADHRSILRDACARHGGHEIDAQGDSMFVAFATAHDALRAAVDGQVALEKRVWPEGATVRVRMGLHTAEPALSDGAYVGLGVHRAARICAAAHGGQVVVSSATRSVLAERGAPGVTLRDLGPHRLKGLGPSERLYEVVCDGLPAGGPRSSRTGGAVGHASRAPRLLLDRRRGAWVAAAGGLLIVAAVVAALGVRGDGTPARALLAPGVVGAIDPANGRQIASATVGGVPDRLVATGRAVWSVSDGTSTLAAIDLRRRDPTTVLGPGGAPRDVAAGFGSVWTIDERGGRLVQIDTGYERVVHRFALPRSPVPPALRVVRSFDPWAVAVGAGAVWVTDGSPRLTRVDPRTGRLARIEAGRPLDGLTVTRDAVWAISGRRAAVVRIDARRRRPTDRIAIASRPGSGSPYPIQIESGLGSVWVLNANTATVTRIDAVQRSVVQTAAIGIDHSPVRIAVGAGAVWAAGADGTLSRLDPTTNAVTTTSVAHRLNDVAVAGGAVWVSAARGFGAPLAAPSTAAPAQGGPTVMPLPASSCSPLQYRPGDRPRLLIASDLPLQAPLPQIGLQIADAVRFVLARHGYRAGRFPVAYQACDDSTPTPDIDFISRCAPNARAVAGDPSVVAVVGSFVSDCTKREVPILNRAAGGPIPEISPSSTYVGLTRTGAGAAPGEPARYAPSGLRSFLRMIAPDDVQAAADAQFAHTLGVRRAYALDDGSGYGVGIVAAFRHAAERLGIRSVGHAAFSTRPQLARSVRESRADAVFLGGNPLPFGTAVITALRRALPPSVRLIASDGFAVPDLLRRAGPVVEGLLVSVPGPPVEALRGPGARFVREFGAAIGQRPYPYAVYAAQATEVLLDALKRSDGTRASLLHELFATRVRNGILGSFAITPDGDITRAAVTMYRVTQGALRSARVITPPASLVGG
jgi:class 3 adenylate cyclase/ABC-type branched-subunit amino acid transport system substrate-binding protein